MIYIYIYYSSKPHVDVHSQADRDIIAHSYGELATYTYVGMRISSW